MRVKATAREFWGEFARKYPLMTDAPQYAAEAYDCASLLIEAIRRAKAVDRARVLSEFRNIKEFSGATGKISFDQNGDLIDPEIGLYQCENGLRKYLGQIREVVK